MGMKKYRHRSIVKKVPEGFREVSSGGQNKPGYRAYAKGSRFNPEKYGKYTVVYVKEDW